MTAAETKTCQNCKQSFIIEPDDFSFYEKMKVPPPAICPDCRFRQRALFRNERTLYHRTCGLCGKKIISAYHPKSPYVVYCVPCFTSDNWDRLSFFLDFDFKKPFFDQLGVLFKKVPKQALYITHGPTNVNSEYINYAGPYIKNSYLVFNSGEGEDVFYSRGIRHCKYSGDLYFATFLENAYECINCHHSSGLSYGQNVTSTVDSLYMLNCSGCTNCFSCVNVRNKKHCFFNEQLAKEEYEKRVKEIRGSYAKTKEAEERFGSFALKFPRRENQNLKAVNCVGDYLTESKNTRYSFEAGECEDCRYAFFSKNMKDSYDTTGYGYQSELLLSTAAVGYSSRVIGSALVSVCRDVEYSFGLESCNNCIGCDGLKNAEFCVLNKRYSEEEYRKIRTHIVEELMWSGVYGLSLPPQVSSFAYNETIGQDNLPLSREEALAQGLGWQDDIQATKGQETMPLEKIPDHINDATPSIVNEIFACEECERNYRIIPAELALYKRLVVPLPRKCFNCRYMNRIKMRGPFTLYDRKCGNCGKSIRTNFAPDRPEIVYCEQCYQAEVA
jgi:hypothetical protein